MIRPRGYSLIELVVTMMIIAILAAVAVPYLTDSETRGSGYYEQVKAAVRFAQRQAVAQHRLVYVCVDANAVSLNYDAGCAPATRLTEPGSSAPFVINTPAGVNLTPNVFAFNKLGQPQPNGADITIAVAGRNILVTSETGLVR